MDKHDKYIYDDLSNKLDDKEYPLFCGLPKNFGELINNDDMHIEKVSSYFTEEFFKEWDRIVEFVNKNYNTFNFLENIIIDAKIGDNIESSRMSRKNFKDNRDRISKLELEKEERNDKILMKKSSEPNKKSKTRINKKSRFKKKSKTRNNKKSRFKKILKKKYSTNFYQIY